MTSDAQFLRASAPRRQRSGLYGGSFDPLHYGHLWPATAAAAALGLGDLGFLVTGAPPHKRGRALAPIRHRFAMVVVGTLPYAELFASPLELDESRPSFTCDTLRAWKLRHPESERFYLIGSDSLAELPSWRDYPDLLDLATFAVLPRSENPGSNQTQGLGRTPELETLDAGLRERLRPLAAGEVLGEMPAAGTILRLATPKVPVSATEIRRRVAAGEPIEGMVPPWVEVYIKRYGLYRS